MYIVQLNFMLYREVQISSEDLRKSDIGTYMDSTQQANKVDSRTMLMLIALKVTSVRAFRIWIIKPTKQTLLIKKTTYQIRLYTFRSDWV